MSEIRELIEVDPAHALGCIVPEHPDHPVNAKRPLQGLTWVGHRDDNDAWRWCRRVEWGDSLTVYADSVKK